MGKVAPSNESIVQAEIRRWKETPLWGIVLALLQVAFMLVAFPALMKRYYAFLLNQGHPFYVTMFVTMALYIVALLWSNLTMFCIYKAKHPFFEQFRAEPDRQFLWEEDSSKWNSFVLRNILILIFNVVIFFPLVSIMLTPDKEHLVFRYDIESWPTPWEMVWEIAFCSLCEDFMFYCTHRILHTGWCYKHIHKLHHEQSQPVSIGSEYAHPLEILISNFIPFYVGPVLLQQRIHYVTLSLWGMYLVCEAVENHCGYDFPWTPFRLIPFSGECFS